MGSQQHAAVRPRASNGRRGLAMVPRCCAASGQKYPAAWGGGEKRRLPESIPIHHLSRSFSRKSSKQTGGRQILAGPGLVNLDLTTPVPEFPGRYLGGRQ